MMKQKLEAREACLAQIQKAYEELLEQDGVVDFGKLKTKVQLAAATVEAGLNALNLRSKVCIHRKINDIKDADRVYDSIKEYYDFYHTSPSLREISDLTAIPVSRVFAIAQHLAVVGRITYFANEKKTIRILNT